MQGFAVEDLETIGTEMDLDRVADQSRGNRVVAPSDADGAPPPDLHFDDGVGGQADRWQRPEHLALGLDGLVVLVVVLGDDVSNEGDVHLDRLEVPMAAKP
ncbi:MAG: hypothetical protein R3F61_25280 [Myxococcota bacterium]